VERSAETTRDDPDGEYLKRNRWFESGSLQRRVLCEPDFRGRIPPMTGGEPFGTAAGSVSCLAPRPVSVGPAAITLDPFEKAFEIRPQLGGNIPGCEGSTRPRLHYFLLLARGLAREQSRGDLVPL
jgi:hypothetical protein